jgi:hypothetical protein
MSDKRIPTTQIDSGHKFTNERGMSVIKDGIKASSNDTERLAKPDWLRMRVQSSPKFDAVRAIVHEHGLATVCEEAKCPNIGECWSAGTCHHHVNGRRLHARLSFLLGQYRESQGLAGSKRSAEHGAGGQVDGAEVCGTDFGKSR